MRKGPGGPSSRRTGLYSLSQVDPVTTIGATTMSDVHRLITVSKLQAQYYDWPSWKQDRRFLMDHAHTGMSIMNCLYGFY